MDKIYAIARIVAVIVAIASAFVAIPNVAAILIVKMWQDLRV